jgi:hypothetical protein
VPSLACPQAAATSCGVGISWLVVCLGRVHIQADRRTAAKSASVPFVYCLLTPSCPWLFSDEAAHIESS